MFQAHERIPSRIMGRPMHLWRYGHFGPPLLVFPTAAGFAHEWSAHGVVEALGDLLAGGRLKLYCTESNVAEAWTRKENPPEHRIRRHQAFEAYVLEELLPWIHADCRTPGIPVGVSGCSLGAFYAANFALKHSEAFPWALCMSGRYEMRHFTGGFSNGDVYFNNPLAYLPSLEGTALEHVRHHAHLTLVCGQGAWEEGCIEETHALADLLAAKGISHHRDIWGRDVSHEWPWWRRQARYHLGRWIGA
jgi:esterase/lipase superfamily enzyme